MNKKEERKKLVLSYIRSYTQENGWSPTFREIQKTFDVKSLATVYSDLTELKNEGKIRYKKNAKRTLICCD